MRFNLNYKATVTLTARGAEILNRNPERERDYAPGDTYTDQFHGICRTFREVLGRPFCEPFNLCVELEDSGFSAPPHLTYRVTGADGREMQVFSGA